MYAALLSTYITDTCEQVHLLSAIETIPSIKAKSDWTLKWIYESKDSFAHRLVAFAAVEGIFFSSSFASIFWIKRKGILHGLCFSNELISRDEGMHTEFACLLFNSLKQKPQEEEVLKIVKEAVSLERVFVEGRQILKSYVVLKFTVTFSEALPVPLLGMSAESMNQYVEFVADTLLLMLGFQKYYCVENPVRHHIRVRCIGLTLTLLYPLVSFHGADFHGRKGKLF